MRRFALLPLVLLVACEEETAPPPAPIEIDASATSEAPAAEEVEDAPVKVKRRPKSIVLAEAREQLGWAVADGFRSRAEMISDAMHTVGRESLRPELERAVDELLLEHKRREREWSFVTHADRLDRAFAQLATGGLIAKLDYTPDADSAMQGVQELHDQLAEKGTAPLGYVFFSQEESTGITQEQTLSLCYGAFDDNDEAHARIGRRVVDALKRQGLEVTWSGNVKDRIELSDLEWRKRRFTRPPR